MRCLYLICIVYFVWEINGVPSVDPIKYHNIAFNGANGLQFSRPYGTVLTDPYPVQFDQLIQPEEIAGIGIFDYDDDGDLDIFVANGPGLKHSLFQNQLIQTNELEFIDVADVAGFGDATAIAQKGAGVCFGDINNDGCTDLLVNGHQSVNLLYVNNCDGTFTFTPNNGIDNNDNLRGSSCSFGDINNDGLIDVVIANSANLDDNSIIAQSAFGPTAYDLFEPNELYLNNGDNTFTDLSAEIQATKFSIGDDPATPHDGNNTLTWVVTMVDIDNDGWLDIVEINDQFGAINSPAARPRGVNQIWYNQGDLTFNTKPFGFIGSWMGLAQGDLNCDGKLDLFVSNFGSYAREVITSLFSPTGSPFSLNYPTRWFFQDDTANGEFAPDTNDINDYSFVSPFGWGCAIFDYDNDGDYDILVNGGLDASYLGKIGDNPGTLWENKDGCFQNVEMIDPETEIFEIDPDCVAATGVAGCTYHSTRNVYAMAIGDLDDDGFSDIVTTSANTVNLANLAGPASLGVPKGDATLDKVALQFAPYQTINFQNFSVEVLNPAALPLPGDLFVEVSSGNSNNFIKITAKGSAGIPLVNGNVNRDGIGAILKVNKMKQAVTGGESVGSGHSFEKIFGLGRKSKADLTIFWPRDGGGYNVNKLDKIKKGESLTIYEIPCDFKTRNVDKDAYRLCVERSTNSLFYQELISKDLRDDLQKSMGLKGCK